MDLNVGKEVAAAQADDRGRTAGASTPTCSAKQRTPATRNGWCKRIVWRIQAQAEGDLSERARQRAAELANDADLRSLGPQVNRPPTAAPATQHRNDDACRGWR